MSKTLEYRGVELNPEPKNTSLADIIGELQDHREVYAQLEPGDATRYDISIKLGMAIAGRPEFLSGSSRFVLVITRWSGWQGATQIVQGPVEQWDLHGEVVHANDHTNDVLTWWLNIVFDLLAEAE